MKHLLEQNIILKGLIMNVKYPQSVKDLHTVHCEELNLIMVKILI